MENSTLNKEVIRFMHCIATRNKIEIDASFNPLTQKLSGSNQNEGIALTQFIIGLHHFFYNKYNDANQAFEKIITMPLENKAFEGMGLMGLGFSLRSAGQLDEATSKLEMAANLLIAEGPYKTFLSYCYQSLGEIHNTINEYEAAIEYFNLAYKHANKEFENAAFFRYHMGLGGTYLKMKSFQKSEYHLLKALEVKDAPSPIVARIENDLGVMYIELKQYDKAEALLENCLTTRLKNGLEDAACTSMLALVEAYLDQQKNEKALDLLDQCLVLVDKFQTKWKKINVLKLLARAHQQNKNYEKAVEYYKEYNTLYDEIKSEQEKNILKFKNEQIEKQKKIIAEKHLELSKTFEEIKRLKVNRKAVIFSWITIIALVVISELFIDPFIENYAYNTLLSLIIKVLIALLFKPLDGLYEKILWERTIKKVA